MPQRSAVEVNPLREGLRIKHGPEPCVMVIFGATGDLTHRKLLPALYNLALEHPLPAGFSVVGFARRPYDDDIFRQRALDAINEFSRQKPVNPQVWESFAAGIRYLQSDFNDPAGYELGAAYALLWSAIEYFQERGIRWLSLGAGAGADGRESTGLTLFKRGWSTETRPVYLCGRIIDRLRYSELSATVGSTDYFPAYRNPDIS